MSKKGPESEPDKEGEPKMKVLYALESVEEIPKESIFLAGPSPRNKDDSNWRPEALKELEESGFTGTVFIPLPRDDVWAENYDDQVEWELEYLEMASVIVFWIPRDLKTLPAFTTNVEYGMYVGSGKIVLGFPKGAPKMRYLEYVARLRGVPVFKTLKDTLNGAVTLMKSIA